MSERDPRVNPQPGDVLRKQDGPTNVRVAIKELRGDTVFYELTDPDRRDPIYRLPLLCNLNMSRWRIWAGSATVVERAQ